MMMMSKYSIHHNIRSFLLLQLMYIKNLFMSSFLYHTFFLSWREDFGKIIITFVYSCTLLSIVIFKFSLLHNFLHRNSPIPVECSFFLSFPVNPFSKTLGKSLSFIPHPYENLTFYHSFCSFLDISITKNILN